MAGVPCIILAGGLGTRLRSVTGTLPKCLAPVAGRPFLWWQMKLLRCLQAEPVVLSLCHEAQQVMQATAGWGVEYEVEPKALGTGGAIAHVMQCRGFSEALVFNGDTHVGGSLQALCTPLNLQGHPVPELLRMATVLVPDRSRFGGVQTDPFSRVTAFLEKGQTDAGPINAGVYRVHRSAFALPEVQAAGDSFSFESVVMPALCAQRSITAQAVDGPFVDIGVPEDYGRYCRLVETAEGLVQGQP